MRLLIVIMIFFCLIIEDSYGANWPLRISTSGKYLEDQSGVPFFVLGDAGWELTTQISDEDSISYIDDRASRGFTALEIRIIGHLFQDNAPNDYYNNAPFTNGHTDWSLRNEKYWTRMDTILAYAKSKNMIVFVFPAYLGYNCGTEGWCPDMLTQTDEVMTNYGEWIGNRYKDYGNIIWMTAGDYNATGTALSRMTAVLDGIKTYDTDAIVIAEANRDSIAGIDVYSTLVDINGVYTWNYPQSKIKTAYADSKPSMFQEGCYENVSACSYNTLTYQVAQAMMAYLGGSLVGHIFGSCPLWSLGGYGGCSSSSPPFDTWKNNLASVSSVAVGNVSRLMKSRKWWTFVPDYNNTVVTSSKGSEYSYHATAREIGGQTVMVWCPNTNQVTVDMTKISGTSAKCWWWNPDDNTSVLIGTYDTTGTRNFTPTSGRKVLVLDNAVIGLAQPGTTVYPFDNVPPSPPTNFQIIP